MSTSCESRIQSRVQIAILRHILLALPALTGASTISMPSPHHTYAHPSTDADTPFAMRMVARACLPGSDPDVLRDAHALAAKLGPTATNTPVQCEPCPACQAPVPFASATAAECPHGHVWGASAPSGMPSVSKRLSNPTRF